MMKTVISTAALLLLVVQHCWATPRTGSFPYRYGAQLRVTPFGFGGTTFTTNENIKSELPRSHVLVSTRGGSDAFEADGDMLEKASEALLVLFATMSAFHGFVLACYPVLGRKMLGTGVEEGDTVAEYAEEGIGVFTIEYGLTAFLAASGRTSPEKAIGYGTIPDLLFLSKNLFNGKFSEFGVQNLMRGITVFSAGCTYGILADKLHLGPIIEILSIAGGFQGGYKYLYPVRAGKKMLGTDLSDKPVAKALFRTSGQMKLVSAFFRGAIAFGVKPLRALSYTSFFNSILVLDSIFVRNTPSEVGTEKALPHQLGVLVLSLTMGVVWCMNSE